MPQPFAQYSKARLTWLPFFKPPRMVLPPARSSTPEALAPRTPEASFLTYPERHVQVALCRATACCEPLRRAATGRFGGSVELLESLAQVFDILPHEAEKIAA